MSPAAPPVVSSDEILDELDQHHQGLSPMAQSVIGRLPELLGVGHSLGSTGPSAPMPVAALPEGAGSSPAPGAPMIPPVSLRAPEAATVAELKPLVKGPDGYPVPDISFHPPRVVSSPLAKAGDAGMPEGPESEGRPPGEKVATDAEVLPPPDLHAGSFDPSVPSGNEPKPPRIPTAAQAEYTRLTSHTPGSFDPTTGREVNRSADQSLSGIAQIKNPWARVPLQVLDTIGKLAAPGLEQVIPGTEGHHEALVGQARGKVGAENEQQKAADEAAKAQADIGHTGAETEESRARAEKERQQAAHAGDKLLEEKDFVELKTPVTDPTHPELGPQVAAINRKTGEIRYLGGNPEGKAGPVHYETTPDGKVLALSTDRSGKHTAEVVYSGDPKTKTEVVKLQVGGRPHTVIVNDKGETIKDLGESGEKPATVNVNAGISALDRESTHFGAGHQKAVDAANAQLEKIADARSLITTGTAESKALAAPKVLTALISGQGTGVRITQAELNQIANATGIKGKFENWVSDISGKGKLNAEQQRQLTEVLDKAGERLVQKRAIANEALNNINGSKSREEMIQHDKAAREALAKFENGGLPSGERPPLSSFEKK